MAGYYAWSRAQCTHQAALLPSQLNYGAEARALKTAQRTGIRPSIRAVGHRQSASLPTTSDARRMTTRGHEPPLAYTTRSSNSDCLQPFDFAGYRAGPDPDPTVNVLYSGPKKSREQPFTGIRRSARARLLFPGWSDGGRPFATSPVAGCSCARSSVLSAKRYVSIGPGAAATNHEVGPTSET